MSLRTITSEFGAGEHDCADSQCDRTQQREKRKAVLQDPQHYLGVDEPSLAVAGARTPCFSITESFACALAKVVSDETVVDRVSVSGIGAGGATLPAAESTHVFMFVS